MDDLQLLEQNDLSNNKPFCDVYYKDFYDADIAYTEALLKFVTAKQNGKYGISKTFPVRFGGNNLKEPTLERRTIRPFFRRDPVRTNINKIQKEYSYDRQSSFNAFNQANDFFSIAPNVWFRPGVYVGPTRPEQTVAFDPKRNNDMEFENSASSILERLNSQRAKDFHNIRNLTEALDRIFTDEEIFFKQDSMIEESKANVGTSTPSKGVYPLLSDSILSPIPPELGSCKPRPNVEPQSSVPRLYADVLQGPCKNVEQCSSSDLEREAIEQYKDTSFVCVIGKMHHPKITPSQDLEQQAVDQYCCSGSQTNMRFSCDMTFPLPNRLPMPSGKYLQPVNQPSYAEATQQGRLNFH